MRRVWILLAALVGLATGFVAAFLIGIEATVSSECDGPCFDRWDEVILIACGVGALCAVVFACAAWGFQHARSARGYSRNA
ncbi:MAG: hypothetical protein ABWY12_10690 [Burkholderiales bacterium]